MAGLGNRLGEFGNCSGGDADIGFVGGDADCADIVLGHPAPPTEQGQYPFRIGVVAPADIHFEPDRIVEAFAVAFFCPLGASAAVVEHIFGLRHLGAVGLLREVALICASLHIPDPKSERDARIAATAINADLTLVIRNVGDFAAMGVKLIDAFKPEAGG